MENDFEVNENDLDGEVLHQAQLYKDWSDKAAAATKEKNKIYLRRKIMKARLYKEAKEKFEKEGKKATGNDLEAEVRTNEEYKFISQELIDAEEKESVVEGGKWAMVEKGKSLERLCADRDRGWFMPSSVNKESLKDVDLGLRAEMKQRKINRG